MTALEDRIRAGLNADRAVPDLWEAVQQGARRRRARRNAGIAGTAAIAVAVIVAGASLATGWPRSGEAPVPPATQIPTPTGTASGSPIPAGAPVGAITLADTGEGFFAVLDSGQVWRRDADGWHELGPPADSAGMVFAPTAQQLWTYDQQSNDGGRTWQPLSRAQDPSCSPVPSVATSKVFLLMPRWCVGGNPANGGWDGPAYVQVLGTDRWQARDLPSLLETADPATGPARFLTVGDAIVATTDSRSVGHHYVVSRDDGASWEAPVTYPCDNGDLATDPDHTALLAACPEGQGSSVWRASNLTHWAKVADLSGVDAISDAVTRVPLGPEAWLFVDAHDESATLVTADGDRRVAWPDGLGVAGVASIGADLYVATVEMGRNGIAGDYGGIYVSHDGGRTWEPDQ